MVRMQRRALLLSGLPWPLWAGAAGSAPWTEALARDAVALLADAASHGLDPADYDTPALARALEAGTLGDASAASFSASAPVDLTVRQDTPLETRLDAAVQRYLQDLHFGRIDPRTLGHDYRPARPAPFDAGAVLRQARASGPSSPSSSSGPSGRLADAAAAAVPPLPLYGHLRQALARCRALTGDPAWATPLPPLPRAGAVKDIAGWDGLAVLRARLRAWGDETDGLPPQAALSAFQRRHGLADDGVLGRATWAALQVTPAQRARQIELALERLRWTPRWQGPRMIVVNIPEYMLRACEVIDGRIHEQVTMKVVVGKAAATPTPLIDKDLRAIEFSPYWNVPPSIARRELVPHLRRDPNHWVSEGFEFVSAGGQVDTTLSVERLDAVLAGSWRIRQRPGPRNALGDIKFVFPNREAIYMHHTPSVGLFERPRRDFSHGCIRIEQPEALAQWVLRDQTSWDLSRIRSAMTAGTSRTLAVGSPVPVLMVYETAQVQDGRLCFYEDVYGLDRQLDAALQARPRPEVLPR